MYVIVKMIFVGCWKIVIYVLLNFFVGGIDFDCFVYVYGVIGVNRNIV